MGDWQEVWDENTGCYYYWNTGSNEVTWELPQCLAAQVQGAQGYGSRWGLVYRSVTSAIVVLMGINRLSLVYSAEAPVVSGAVTMDPLPETKEEAAAVTTVSSVVCAPVKREAKKVSFLPQTCFIYSCIDMDDRAPSLAYMAP